MFKRFKPKIEITLSHHAGHVIRTNTLDLIHIANHSENTRTGRAPAEGAPAKRRTMELLAVSNAERRLASSIAGAVSRSVSIQSIVSRIVEPAVSGSLVVSKSARACVARALDLARKH